MLSLFSLAFRSHFICSACDIWFDLQIDGSIIPTTRSAEAELLTAVVDGCGVDFTDIREAVSVAVGPMVDVPRIRHG